MYDLKLSRDMESILGKYMLWSRNASELQNIMK